MDILLVFLSAFLGFLASYLVARIVAWELQRKKAATALLSIREELQQNRAILASSRDKPARELNHALFFQHQWNSAIQNGDLLGQKPRNVLGDLASVYRILSDVENWTALLIQTYFGSGDTVSSAKSTRDVERLAEFIQERQDFAIERIDDLLRNPNVWNMTGIKKVNRRDGDADE